MATFDMTSRCKADVARLSPGSREKFKAAALLLAESLNSGASFPKSLRVRRFNRSATEWELTWAPNGRAVFELHHPSPLGATHKHVRWVAVGGHEVFDNRRAANR